MATDGRPETEEVRTPNSKRRRPFFAQNSTSNEGEQMNAEPSEEGKGRPTKWSMGVMNDPATHEVPGSVLLLTGYRNEPLGLRNAPARTSASSLPTQPSIIALSPRQSRQASASEGKKKTKDGAIILEPQPDDSHNDPLNWPTWRRDSALISLGLYCMVGGGMTPILAAGFTNVAATYNVTTPQVALTTGLYMMGLGVGSVIASPTAILYGKRPVYLVSAIIFIISAVWCAVSPNYNSLLVARIFQGISVSPVECLPSATIAEIFFLHERAYRIGVYTLLLLGGKNLVPLVSAAVIQSLGWRWVFWVVAFVVGFCAILLLLFVPETFWDRTPRPKTRNASKNTSKFSLFSHGKSSDARPKTPLTNQVDGSMNEANLDRITSGTTAGCHLRKPSPVRRLTRDLHVGFATDSRDAQKDEESKDVEKEGSDYLDAGHDNSHIDNDRGTSLTMTANPPPSYKYTADLKARPRLTFLQQLKPYNGRLHHDNWFRVAIRPFILFAYPAVLWSSVVYACAVGWLIVLSESVAVIYRSRTTYGFSALSTGLIYLSPFIGGILGTAVAGKVSDIIVRAMSRRNGGLYEPEFRLVMAAPVAVTTVIGLMGFGWSADVHDAWIVPTIFFGVISFGCSLASTTAITFCVDSYRQYAGEALVTLNFSKNIFHGLVFSLFFNNWLEHSGPKSVFIWLGVIQLILMSFTIPMYIFGKRARMWTVRKNLMEMF